MTATIRTRRLEADADLLAVGGRDGFVFLHDGHGLAGRGVAGRIALPGPWPDAVELAARELAAMDVDDELGRPGSGVVAFAALPFERDASAELIIPEVVVGRSRDGTRWITTVGDHDADAEALPRPPLPEPSRHELVAERPPEAWAEAVADAAKRIRAGELDKVVLARELEIRTDAPIDRGVVLDRLARAFPSSMVYAVEGFVGASPELLVGRTGDVVRAQPMAGTTPRTGDPTRDVQLAAALLASPKDRQEHQFTIDAVHDGLLPWCSYLDAGTEPEVFSVANVQHLASTVEGRLSHPPVSVLQLVAGLHPTPAVGGQPTDEALRLLRAIEGRDRGPYAGPVGWVDGAGNGRFAVGLRGAELDGTAARVMSGVGVVADSDPAAELAETRAKLRAILGALVSP
ncbi:MAG: isochorismate synthase [Actinomycetota bacterium]